MKAGRRRGADRLPRGGRARPRGRRGRRRGRRRGAREPRRAGGARACVTADAAIVTEPTELELVVAHKGFVWSRSTVTGRAAHGSRPHLGVDAIVKAGPVLIAICGARRGARRERAPAARPRLGPRVADRGRRRSSRATRRAASLGLERRTLPGETAADVEAELDALLELPSADPDARRERGRCWCASRSRSTRTPRSCVGRRRARSGAPRGRRRELLGRRGVHRRGRHPDGAVRPVAARARTPPRSGSASPTRRPSRGRWSPSRRACSARERVRQPGARPGRGAAPAAPRRGVPPRAAGLRADAAARAPRSGRELGVAAVLLKDESDRLGLPAFKVLGASWAVERALRERTRRSTRSSRRAPGNHGRAVAHVAAPRGLRVPRLPARALGAGAARGDRRRGRRGRGRRRHLRGGGGARARRGRRGPACVELADVGDSGRGRVGDRRLRDAVRRAGEQAEFDSLLVPVGVGSLARRGRALRGAPRGVAVVGVEPDTAACLTASLAAGEPTAVADARHDDGRARLRRGLGRRLAVPAGRDPGTVTVSDAEVHAAMRSSRPGWRSATAAPRRRRASPPRRS